MIHVFLGTKAQLIKMAPIMRELQDRNIPYNFIFSGQHQETIQDIRANFGIKVPDYTVHSGSDINSIPKMLFWLIKVTLHVLKNPNKVWAGDKNGVVLNHGDTFSTLLGSLLAKISGQKNAHVESGLRSFRFFHPFPEEITRILVFKLTDIYFAPGSWALSNLSKYKGAKVNTEINTLADSLRHMHDSGLTFPDDVPDTPFAIVSVHRFENLSSVTQLQKIVDIIEDISHSTKLLFILHSPTLRRLKKTGLYDKLASLENVELRPRYDYFRFINLVKNAEFVVTDGGSNQEECAYLGKPCLILRNATERQEGLDQNAVLSKFDANKVKAFLNNYKTLAKQPTNLERSPTKIIVDSLQNNLSNEN